MKSKSLAGCNLFLPSVDYATWTGTFTGTSTEYGTAVVHCNGNVSFDATASFEGVADGRSGTLEISQNGQCCDENGLWQGRWVILSGTGELANLRGQGNWFGPGAGGFGLVGYQNYDGNYHFEPE